MTTDVGHQGSGARHADPRGDEHLLTGEEAVEHVDVLVVGAGLSGIGAAHHLQAEVPWASYALLEARDAIGGTWDLFRYPGIRSDSDMFTLGYPFRPWDGERSIADGASILQYIRATAAEAGIDRHVRYRHRVVAAAWSTETARWHVTAEQVGTGRTVQLTCSFLMSCTGYYRYEHGYTPDFAGMDRFDGTIVHPQQWPDDLDVQGKRVVVIGSGATAVTLVPALARTAAHVTMLQRSPTWIASLPGRNPVADVLRRVLPAKWAGPALRWTMALSTLGFFELSRRCPGFVKRALLAGARRQLPAGYDVATHFTPRYDPWDQRLCVVPDGDLFAAIRDGSASVVTDHIDTFTATGVRLRSGTELDADVVVTATGLDLLFLGGIELSVDGEAVDPATRVTYKGMMLQGVPNLAFAIGYTNASWTLKCELTCSHLTRVLQHLRASGMRQCTPLAQENRPHASVGTDSLLGLTSGYVQRSADQFPKQGAADPWRVHQNYLRDVRSIRLHGIEDGAIVFSNPQPQHIPAASARA